MGGQGGGIESPDDRFCHHLTGLFSLTRGHTRSVSQRKAKRGAESTHGGAGRMEISWLC